MFPAPSPNTQAIFNLQSAGVTPGSSDFQQAALRAAAAANHNKATTSGAPTSQPEGVTSSSRSNSNSVAKTTHTRIMTSVVLPMISYRLLVRMVVAVTTSHSSRWLPNSNRCTLATCPFSP
jgi:hypothetical protein